MKGWHTPVWVLMILVLVATALIGCPGRREPTTTPVPTATPRATATPRPTATPTSTPLPLSAWVNQGYEALVQSDFHGAVELFEKAVAVDPNYWPAYVGLAMASYRLLGEEPRALEFASKAVELAPDSPEAHAALARAHWGMGNADEALQAAETAAELDGTDPRVQVTLAEAYLSTRDYEESMAAIQRALDLDPELAEAYGVLGAYYTAVSDAARSQAAYEAALAREPNFAYWHIALGDLWQDQGRYDLAQAELDLALELAPEFPDALLRLASLAMDSGDYDAAAGFLDRATAVIPNAPQPYVSRGHLYRAQGEADDARAQYRRALDQRANYGAALRGMGWSYLDEGESDLAIRQFQTLMAERPRSPDGLIGMGFARLYSGDPVKALEYLRKAARLDPYEEWAHVGLGRAYRAQERWEEATLAYAEALRVGFADAAVHVDLGDVFYYRQEDLEASEAEFELALRLLPDAVENGYAHTSLGFLELQDGKPGMAETRARAALELDPENTLARLLLGMALVRQEKNREAIEVLEELIGDEPEYGTAHGLLGVAYKRVERFPDAKKALEANVALQSGSGIPDQVYALIEALDQGYLMTEAKALQDLTGRLEEQLETTATAQVMKGEDGGRTLAVFLAAQPDWEQQIVLFQMAAAMSMSSLYLPRIEPAIEGGLTVQLAVEGEPVYALTADHTTAVEFADGLLGPAEFVSLLEFRQLATGPAEATVDEVKAAMSGTRELSATVDVPYQLLAEEELRARYEAQMDDEDQQDLQADQAMLALLGIIDPQIDLAQLLVDLDTEQASGFYDTQEEIFYLVERGESTTADQMTVAHEYAHALQDQHYDLDALLYDATNSDEQAAIAALVEGDATLAMLLYGEEHVMLYDMMEMISEAGGMESDVLEASPDYIRQYKMFPYVEGLQFVAALYDSGAWEAVGEAYQAPPLSTEQVLHPERYRQGDQPLEVVLPDIAGKLGAAWQEMDRDVMGELGLRLYLREHVGPAMAALASEGWGGDGYILLRNGLQGPYLVLMQTTWDNQEESDQFWALFQVAMSHRPEYQEEIKTLLGEPEGHWWHGDAATVFARQDGEWVLIAIGPDADTVEAAVDLVDSAIVTG